MKKNNSKDAVEHTWILNDGKRVLLGIGYEKGIPNEIYLAMASDDGCFIDEVISLTI